MFSDESVQVAEKYFPRKMIMVPYLLVLFAINLANLIIEIVLLNNLNKNKDVLQYVGTIVMVIVLSVIIGFLLLILLFGKIFFLLLNNLFKNKI